MKNFTIDTRIYNEAKPVLSKCNSIEFVNKGTAQVKVNGYPLNTNDSVSFSGNAGEVDQTTYQLYFDSVGTKELYIFRKLDSND